MNERSIFPDDFIWSVSTSAYQFEGARDLDGKGLSIQDVKTDGKGNIRTAMDHYHRYKEDVALLGKLGINGYRFSISWSRIIPDGSGEINTKGLEFYHNVINECLKYGIKPIVTMYHDDMPYSLAVKGGWSNKETVDYFVRYCRILFEEFGKDVAFWQPICEQNLLTIENLVKQEGSYKEVFEENHNMFLAQARVFKMYHDMKLPGKIGPALNLVTVYPDTSSPWDLLACRNMEQLRNWMYLDLAVNGEYSRATLALLEKLKRKPDITDEDMKILKEGTCDYVSFSCYTSVCVKAWDEGSVKDETGMKYGFNMPGLFKIVPNRHLGYTEFASEVDPIGTSIIINDVYNRYHKPVLSIQRGYGCKEEIAYDGCVHDEKRISYLKLQLEQLEKVIEDGTELLGYCSWSGFDVVSTSNGVDKRYGMIYIDVDNEGQGSFRRIPKDSYYWFKKVIENKGKRYD